MIKISNANKPLRNRLTASFSTIIMICVISISIICTIYFTSTVKEQNFTHTAQMLEQVQYNVDAYVKGTEEIISILSRSPEVVEYMRLPLYQEDTRVEYETSLRKLLLNYKKELKSIAGIIISSNSKYVSNEFYRLVKDSFNNEHWYKSAVENPDRLIIVPKPIKRNLRNWMNYSGNEVVMLSKAVIDPLTGKPLGVIAADLKLDEIASFLSELKLGQKGTIFIMDENGEVVYTPINPLVYRVRSNWFGNNDISEKQFSANINGDPFAFLYSVSKYTGWKTIGMFSQEAPPGIVSALQGTIAIVAIIILIFGILTGLVLTRSVTEPILHLQKLMKQAEDGDLKVYYENKNSYDIDKLGASFNTMISKIRELLEVVLKEQKSKREAELKALQAQINPHFLYNTLDTIHWMAKEYNALDIVDLVNALTKLFRIGLSKGKEYINLSEEIAHVESYLHIQKVRYEEKLSYTLKVDESLYKLKILKIIIQPLVENAIYHGIKEKQGNGNIYISVFKEGRSIIIEVADDGAGMESSMIDEINNSLKSNENQKGYGIYNVNERLMMHFGSEFFLILYANEYGGITSKIKHPIL